MADFPRSDRLTSKQDIQIVFANAKRVSHSNLLAVYRFNQMPNARLGIMVAKQHVKRAVDRNRIRRIVRESFRQHKETLKGLDIIVLIRSQCIPVSTTSSKSRSLLLNKNALRNDVDNLWQLLSKMD